MTRDEWQRRLGPLYGGAVAVAHSTSLSWESDEAAPPAPIWMVAVGAAIGALAYLVAAALHALHVPAPVAALFGLAVLTFASAALVERGVVARIDRGASTPSVLAILVLVFGTLVRAAAIMVIAPDRWLAAYLTTALVGRWAAAFLQGIGDPITETDTHRSLVVAHDPAWLTAAISLSVFIIAVLALGKAGIVAMAVSALLVFALGVATQRRDGGLSAPVVACAAAIAELVVLVAASA